MNVTKSKTNGEHAPQWRRAHPRWVQIAVLLVVFVLGGFVGGMIGVNSVYSRMEYLRSNPDALPSMVVPRLERLLSLTDEQSVKLREIIGRRHPKIAEYRDQGMVGMHAEFDAMAKEVASILDEEQSTKWEAVADNIRSRFLPR